MTSLDAKNNLPPKESKLYTVFAMVFVASLLISNIAAQKLFAFGPVVFTAGIIIFPISYICGDVLTEVWGYSRARIIIWSGFAANVFLSLVLWIAIKLPPAPGWPLQTEFETVLGLVPRIVFASIIGYWAGEFVNSYVLAKMKIFTRGKWLPARTIASTVAGQLIDTTCFVLIAFTAVFDSSLLFKTILYGWAFKVSYEIIATPITVIVIRAIKKYEGFDHYDYGTNFNPFVFYDAPSPSQRDAGEKV